MSKVHWYAPFKGKFDPVNLGPEEGPFVCVSFNASYLPFVTGALKALLQRQMWRGTEEEIDLMTMKAHELLYLFGIGSPCPDTVDMTGEFEDMASLCESLRWEDGKLQALCCGEWTDVDGASTRTLGGLGQPGNGTPQPAAGGGEQCYHANTAGSRQWLLPTAVSTGDILTCSNFDGASWDGFTVVPLPGRWDCPDGKYFFLGACQEGTEALVTADPKNTVPHMSLICQIAGVWYSCLSPITVPAGVSNAQVVFQLNDNLIGDNQGEYAFDVCVKNNAAVHFVHTFDFLTGAHGWTVDPAGGGVYVAGVGFQSTVISGDKRLTLYSAIVPAFNLSSFESIGVFQDASAGGTRQAIYWDTTWRNQINLPSTAGAFDTLSSTPHTGVIRLGANLDTYASATGVNKLTKVIVAGSGLDPF